MLLLDLSFPKFCERDTSILTTEGFLIPAFFAVSVSSSNIPTLDHLAFVCD